MICRTPAGVERRMSKDYLHSSKPNLLCVCEWDAFVRCHSMTKTTAWVGMLQSRQVWRTEIRPEQHVKCISCMLSKVSWEALPVAQLNARIQRCAHMWYRTVGWFPMHRWMGSGEASTMLGGVKRETRRYGRGRTRKPRLAGGWQEQQRVSQMFKLEPG